MIILQLMYMMIGIKNNYLSLWFQIQVLAQPLLLQYCLMLFQDKAFRS